MQSSVDYLVELEKFLVVRYIEPIYESKLAKNRLNLFWKSLVKAIDCGMFLYMRIVHLPIISSTEMSKKAFLT